MPATAAVLNICFELEVCIDLRRLATRGKLEACHARLDSAQVDDGLRKIVRDCLELEPHDRPADAAEVARMISHYLESVEERARQSQLDSIASGTRAAEERKRRRLTSILAASLVTLVVTVTAGVIWTQEQQSL